MSLIKIRALSFAAIAVMAFLAMIAIQSRQENEPTALCDIKSMKCYEQLGSAR